MQTFKHKKYLLLRGILMRHSVIFQCVVVTALR